MKRFAFTVVMTLAAPGAFLMSSALAQTPPPSQKILTPQQHEQVKALNAKFTACHNKAVAAKVGPKDRRAFMKSCLAG